MFQSISLSLSSLSYCCYCEPTFVFVHHGLKDTTVLLLVAPVYVNDGSTSLWRQRVGLSKVRLPVVSFSLSVASRFRTVKGRRFDRKRHVGWGVFAVSDQPLTV